MDAARPLDGGRDRDVGGAPLMPAARLAHSPRLQRVLAVLSDAREHSTLDLVRATDVLAINSVIHELRCNGYDIACRSAKRRGRRVWLYQLKGGSDA